MTVTYSNWWKTEVPVETMGELAVPIIDGSDDGDPFSEFYSNSRYNDADLVGGETDAFPSGWRYLDQLGQIEVRSLSLDTYQVRSKTHTITLNREGFDLYRDKTDAGHVLFEDWCNRNNVQSEIRTFVNE